MSYELIRETQRTARKNYRCIWCGERIGLGQHYIDEFSKFDGDIQKHKWHPECRESSYEHFRHEPEFCPYDNDRPARPPEPTP